MVKYIIALELTLNDLQTKEMEKEKEDRLRIYKLMLDDLEETKANTTNYMCYGFCAALHFATYKLPFQPIITELPELMRYKPRHFYNGSAYWFDPLNRDIRINIILEIIKDLEVTPTQRIINKLKRLWKRKLLKK
jgi:hypothetical protein